MNKIKVIRVRPYQTPELIKIENTLNALQMEVGGYIQAIFPFEDPVAIVCNEEAKLMGLPLNRGLYDEDGQVYDVIAGTFLITGLGEEDFDSIGEYAEKYIEKYKRREYWLG